MPRPILPNGRDIRNPSTSGTATPASATKTAARPVLFISSRFVSRPAENIKRSTPTFENTESAFSRESEISVKYPPSEKPIIAPPHRSPKIAGPIKIPAIM